MMSLSPIRHKQQGSALILTIFIIIVIGFLALMMTKNQQKVSTHIVTSVMGTRTNMAAKSAIQMDISEFYMNQSGSCYSPLTYTSDYTFSGEGLSQCRATVECKTVGNMDSGIIVRQLISTAQCQFGTTTLQRIIEVGIRHES